MTTDERLDGLSEEKRRLLEKLRQQSDTKRAKKKKKRASGPVPPPPGGEASVVALKSEGDGIPFICVHAITGSVFPYHKLALQMEQRPFYGIQAHGLLPDQEPRKTIPEMARAYVNDLKKYVPKGPYHLGGYSFGGWVAFEMAQLLKDEMGCLAVFGVPITGTAHEPRMAQQWDYAAQYMDDWGRLVRNTAMAEGMAPTQAPQAQAGGMAQVIWANGWAQARWVPDRWPGRLDLFRTTEQVQIFQQEPTMGWKLVCDDIHLHDIEGNHLNLFEDPQVKNLATALESALERAE